MAARPRPGGVRAQVGVREPRRRLQGTRPEPREGPAVDQGFGRPGSARSAPRTVERRSGRVQGQHTLRAHVPVAAREG